MGLKWVEKHAEDDLLLRNFYVPYLFRGIKLCRAEEKNILVDCFYYNCNPVMF